jgi:hypothetical protein
MRMRPKMAPAAIKHMPKRSRKDPLRKRAMRAGIRRIDVTIPAKVWSRTTVAKKMLACGKV